ncbi:hypothetical protein AAWM_08635 [Aspergillus awamori]|uniref:Uncharacterized protein n=1 Tax=Aspergillus awamori TaxID=105351 RepID=A0A401L2J1_ASPAW|nr:hypothetical protein AAWM_08635 [Aspergillus awamori]GKZ58911.1 hypothetical protein AnigIFM49718_004754 [Aspergillus niger]
MGSDDASGSNLSSPRYGFDFVVSTTQASINSGLKLWLAKGDHPVKYMYFLVDEYGNPTIEKTREELLVLSGGIDPFDIPAETSPDDPRVAKLTEIKFNVGLRMKMGLPPGIMPVNLPAVVTLGGSANNVGFRLFCSEFTIVQNTPGGWIPGRWDVWSQPPGEAWYFETTVNLMMISLNDSLDTKYLNDNPDIKAQLLEQLRNISGTAYSLQQLLFDLDTALLQTVPTIAGLPAGSPAEQVLLRSFILVYSKAAQEKGLPLLSITAVAQVPDPSPLQLTGFERQVSPLKKGDKPINNPTPQELEATTLDHLCATGHKPLPRQVPFDWNWVDINDVDSYSGTIAINRNTIAQYVLDAVLPNARDCCFDFDVKVTTDWLGRVYYDVWHYPGQEPQTARINSDGRKVIEVSYHDDAYDEDRWGAYYGDMRAVSDYTADVTFVNNTVTVRQYACIYINVNNMGARAGVNAYKMTVTDTYEISVDQYGGLQMQRTATDQNDESEDPNASGVANLFTGINNIVSDMKRDLAGLVAGNMKEVPFNELRSFVFPGSRVFTYQGARFSDYQDLVSAITYVEPRQGLETAKANSVFTLTYSSELMQNYLRGQVVSPEEKFEALQTAGGLSLLFSLDTAQAFHVIEEQNGTATGWEVKDLSSDLIRERFPDEEAVVSTFEVGQNVANGSISLAMAIAANGSDNLFVSLQNDSADTSWTNQPSWTHLPFDAVGDQPSAMTIASIFFAETPGLEQYLMVDIDRSQDSANKHIVRYYVSPSKSTGRYWTKHDVPVDIDSGAYQSCAGRKSKFDGVDGIYTSGHTASMPQLVYVPMINEWGTGPPLPIRLSLPGGQLPSAIAAARHDTSTGGNLYGTTDLYAISGDTLYRFPVDEQYDGAEAKALVSNSFLSSTTTLLSMTWQGVTTLWGRNGSNEVYYLSCMTSQAAEPGSWSTPVPILTGVEHIAAYMNRADGGNTIFAVSGQKLYRLIQASETMAKIWRPQEVNIQGPPKLKPQEIKSYTTTVNVGEPATNYMPVEGAQVAITAESHTPVYINGLYYVLGKSPTNVATDRRGSLTIVEATEDLKAATLSVSMAGSSELLVINPMDGPMEKIMSLDTNDTLRNTTIPEQTTAGGVVGTVPQVPLVPRSVSQEDSQRVAAILGRINEESTQTPAARAITGSPYRRWKHKHGRRVIPSNMFRSSLNDVAIAFGDLFRWFKSGLQAAWDFFWDSVSDAWHFIVKMGDKVYHALLDTAEAIVCAVEWLFDTIKTGITELIRFVEFLFEWDDIRRTKDVLHNIAKQGLQHFALDGLNSAKEGFNSSYQTAQNLLATWAGVASWDDLGHAAQVPAADSGTDPTENQTSASLLLATHFSNNASSMEILSTHNLLVRDDSQPLFDALLEAISEKGGVLSDIYQRLQGVAQKFKSQSVGEVIKEIAVILAQGLLSEVKVVFDALVDVLSALAQSALELLDTEIYIPVVSDILDLLGVRRMSLLDLFTWIAAVAFTVVHKIVYDQEPFPDNEHTDAIIAASDWEALRSAIEQGNKTQQRSTGSGKKLGASLKKTMFIACHATCGFTMFCGNFLSAFEAESPTGENPFSLPATIAKIVATGMQVGGDFLVPVYPVENTAVSTLSAVTGGLGILNGIFFSGAVQRRIAAPRSGFVGMLLNDGRATSSIIDTILIFPALFVTGWHFYELSGKPAGAERSAAIVGEVTNLILYITRISYAVAVNDPDETSKQIPIGIMAVSRVVASALQTAEAFLEISALEKKSLEALEEKDDAKAQ